MNFKPPDQLSSSVDWPLWRQKFDIYLTATEKSQSEEKVKIATLLAYIGDEGIHVYNSFTEDEKSTLEKLIQAFDCYFLSKKVTAMEAFKVNNMTQLADQSIDQFLTELKKQVKFCDFICSNTSCKKSYEERMIRDRLILGLFDKESQLRLLREKDVDIKKILDYCKSLELSKQHIKVLNPTEEVMAVQNSNLLSQYTRTQDRAQHTQKTHT